MPSGCNAVRVYAIKTSESRLLGLRGRKGRKKERRRKRRRERLRVSKRQRRERESERERGRVKGNRWPRER